VRVKTWVIVLIVVVVVAVAVGGFFGGRATAGGGTPTVEAAVKALQSASPQQLQQVLRNGGGFQGAPNGSGTGRFAGGNAVTGTILSADASSITVKTADGSTKIVLVSSSTTVSKTQEGSISDLTVGQNVIATGTSNSDGTVTASRIQVGATLPNVQGGPGGTAAGGPAHSDTVPAGTAPGATGSTGTTAAQ
jgi:hypothetical protein